MGNLERDVDAPISITFEDCDVSWRDDYPFQTPYYDGAGYLIDAGPVFSDATPAGSLTVRGGSIRGSPGAGIGVYKKHLSGPTVTFADVTLTNTGLVETARSLGFSYSAPSWVHVVSPIMLMDNDGGLGGLRFENVKIVMAAVAAADHLLPPKPFLSYNQWSCDTGIPCPNVTGDIGGAIEVQWQGSPAECVPSLLGDGGVPLVNGSVFGLKLLENVSVTCTQQHTPGPAPHECCQAVAHADCWGFTPGRDATASIQAAIDCPLAHTVVVKDMGAPWVVAPPPLHLPVYENNSATYICRAAINFTRSNQLVIFQPGVVVEAKRWAFHGFKDSLAHIGSEWGAVRNLTVRGEGATWRMWKQDCEHVFSVALLSLTSDT